MATLKSLIILAILAYCGVLALMYVFQRSLMYFPDRSRTPPAAAGLPQAEEVTLTSSDGERLVAWHVPPRDAKPVVIYFQGNAGALNLRADRFRWLTRTVSVSSPCRIAAMGLDRQADRGGNAAGRGRRLRFRGGALSGADELSSGVNRSAPASPSRLPPNADRRAHPRCAVYIRRRHRGFSLSFHTGALVHQRFLPVG